MTHEQLEAKRALQSQRTATVERILRENLTPAEREAEMQHLVHLDGQIAAFDEPPPAVPNEAVAKLSPAAAKARAAEIRAMPEFWRPDTTFGKDGKQIITRQQRDVLARELVELDTRSAGPDEGDAS